MSDFNKMSEVELWPLEKLKPFEDNAKLHPIEQVKALAKSIKQVGFRNNPIEVLKDGTIVNGHGRWMALRELKAPTAPVAVIDDMTPDEVRQYRITHNKIADTGFDNELLKKEVLYLHTEADLDMSAFFSEKEFDFLAGDLGEMDLDAITNDLAEDVDELSTATQKSIDSEKEKTVAVAKVLGYGQVTEQEQRGIARLQAHAEGVTGLSGGAALAAFSQDHVGL